MKIRLAKEYKKAWRETLPL